MKPNTSRGRFRKLLRRGFIILLLATLVSGYMFWSSHRFKAQLQRFSEAERAYEVAAYKPAADSNPVRQRVNQLLTEVLQVKMTDAERIEKARQGIAHLNDIEGQVDAIKVEGDLVVPLLIELDRRASSPGNVRNRSVMKEIVSVARRQAEIIGDIRGLSYRADYYTTEIFERIIDDQGKLTDDHVTSLNDFIPQLEEQFNQRANLYAELRKNATTLQQLSGRLGYVEQ